MVIVIIINIEFFMWLIEIILFHENWYCNDIHGILQNVTRTPSYDLITTANYNYIYIIHDNYFAI